MMKEIIGTFPVTDGTRREQTVYVIQETFLGKDGVILETQKHFCLNGIDGARLRRTKDQNVLMEEDGSILRKNGAVTLGDPDRLTPRSRNRRET